LGLAGCGPNKKTTYEGASRRDALRQAKRDADIQMTQHPSDITKVKLGYGDYIRTPDGVPIKVREYHFIKRKGVPVVIQEHSLGHIKATPMHGTEPHFNVRPIDNLDTGWFPGTHGHYNF